MSLEPIRRLLDREADAGRTIRFWWRDDDAITATPALDRLLGLARGAGLPIAIAAIPADLDPSLPARLREESEARLLVHGLSHANHAEPGHKAAEFGPDRPLGVLARDAEIALETMQLLGGEFALPVFVPPWNRLAPDLPGSLARIGYRGLSTFGAREPQSDLSVVNTHLDPVEWRGSRSAMAPERLAEALEKALAISPGQPVGILTHHLMFDEALWRLTGNLVELLAGHPAGIWPRIEALWPAELRH